MISISNMHPTTTLIDTASDYAYIIASFHEALLVLLSLIIVSVIMFLIINWCFPTTTSQIFHLDGIEVLWLWLPGITLSLIAIPSLRLLFWEDNQSQALFTINVMGHQWYWTYYYPAINHHIDSNSQGITFDSFMVQEEDLENGQFRLLEASPHIVVPYGIPIKYAVTSADVLHSWAINSICINLDAVPGRLNIMEVQVRLPGLYYGQCSEICGANHSFMPITIEAISIKDFCSWLTQ